MGETVKKKTPIEKHGTTEEKRRKKEHGWFDM